MIRYQSQNQISIEEFTTPFQQNLRSDNRWVKLSKIIPWDDMVTAYYKALSEDQGRPGIDGRRIIGALIIKHKLNLSDEETVLQIQENAYLQYFLGYNSYEEKPVFSPTLFVEIRKRLGNEAYDEMQNSIISMAFEAKENKSPRQLKKQNDDDNSTPGARSSSNKEQPSHKGKLLMDATVAEQQIKYPNDLELLNDSRQICETLIDQLYPMTSLDKKPGHIARLPEMNIWPWPSKKGKAEKF